MKDTSSQLTLRSLIFIIARGGAHEYSCGAVLMVAEAAEEVMFIELLRYCRPYMWAMCSLAAEAVEGTALATKRVHDVHGGHCLAARVLSVGDGVADDAFEEDLEDRACLLVDEAGDAFHAATACQTADGGLGDALDVVAKHLAVALGAALTEPLAAQSLAQTTLAAATLAVGPRSYEVEHS